MKTNYEIHYYGNDNETIVAFRAGTGFIKQDDTGAFAVIVQSVDTDKATVYPGTFYPADYTKLDTAICSDLDVTEAIGLYEAHCEEYDQMFGKPSEMVTIRNINENLGMSIEFMAETEEAAVKTMLATIRKCGPEFKDITSLKEGVDYEVV